MADSLTAALSRSVSPPFHGSPLTARNPTRVPRVVKKPPDLFYGVEERPPLNIAIVIAVQHVLAIAVNLVYPLVLAREAGMSAEAAADMLRIGMVALAAGAVLQAIPRGPIGCHYLAPLVYGSPYLAPGFLAIHMGGMPLFWGMTIVAGLSLLLRQACRVPC